MAPTLEAIVNEIRTEAAHWDTHKTLCSGVSAAGDALRMTRLQAGLFQLIVDTNNRVCDLVQAECAQAATHMGEAATALRADADHYEDHELDVTQSIKDIGTGIPGY